MITSDPIAGIAGMSNVDLYNAELSLALACGRSRSALKEKHRQYLCFSEQLFKRERERRGTKSPGPPFIA